MKFYGRESEIAELRKVREISHRFARFTVVTGRRRIGKTELVRQAFDDKTDPYLHLVITKKTEKIQCEKLQEEAVRVLGMTIHGTCTHFSELFEELMKESVLRPFTLVLDEFQFVEETRFVRMCGWWDRKGENEIDLVCDDGRELVFCEIKREKERISLKALENKTIAFFEKNPSLKAKPSQVLALSLEDM